MPPKKALKLGDEVRVKGVDAFNLDWLKSTYSRTWAHEKFDGVVSAKSSDRWTVDFPDGESATLPRSKIEFVSRRTAQPTVHENESSDSEAGAEAAPEHPLADSSDDEDGGDYRFFCEEPDHDSTPAKEAAKQLAEAGRLARAAKHSMAKE